MRWPKKYGPVPSKKRGLSPEEKLALLELVKKIKKDLEKDKPKTTR